jgi:Tol biopolymer transport system component
MFGFRATTTAPWAAVLALVLSSSGLQVLTGSPAEAAVPPAVRISVDAEGGQAKGHSDEAVIAPTGYRIAFTSAAADLVRGDTNGVRDVFVKNRITGAIVRADVTSHGRQANRSSFFPSVSRDGRVVAFTSRATNLVSKDTNGLADIFVKRIGGSKTLVRASTDSSGRQLPDGVDGYGPSLSGDGNRVAFMAGRPSDMQLSHNDREVYVKDLTTGRLILASATSTGQALPAGGEHPSLSSDGTTVAFESDVPRGPHDIPRLVTYVKNLTTGGLTCLCDLFDAGDGDTSDASISGDGRRVAFVHDGKVKIADLKKRTVTLVAATTSGTPMSKPSGRPAISSAGKSVAFVSGGHVWVKQIVTGELTRVTYPRKPRTDDHEIYMTPSITAGAAYVAFTSQSADFVRRDTNGRRDVFFAGVYS